MATCTNCGYCTYMDVTKEKEGKFYCEHLDGYQFADSEDSKDCNYQCERFSRDMYLGDDAIKVSKAWKKSHSSSGCFITTVVVNILGYDDNNNRSINNCFYSKACTGDNTYGGTGANDESLKQQIAVDTLGEAFALDKNNINNGYIILKWELEKE